MDPITLIVSANIKRLRKAHNLSLDDLANLSGVSKSLLAQIERGNANPTLSTLWKISASLRVPFDALTLRSKHNYEIVSTDQIHPIVEDSGRVRNYVLFPDDDNRKIAIYYMVFEQGAYLSTVPHTKDTLEFIMLIHGEMTIRCEDSVYMIKSGESLRFNADVSHSYQNSGNDTSTMYMVICLP